MHLTQAVPQWLVTIRKDTRARSKPYPGGCILLASKLMCDRLIPASLAGAVMKNIFEDCGLHCGEYSWPSRKTIGEWRVGFEAIAWPQPYV